MARLLEKGSPGAQITVLRMACVVFTKLREPYDQGTACYSVYGRVSVLITPRGGGSYATTFLDHHCTLVPPRMLRQHVLFYDDAAEKRVWMFAVLNLLMIDHTYGESVC
jgi:hypothetical protein